MKPVHRLALAVALLVLWLSWLGYLALTSSQPVILSKPQVQASAEITVLAELDDHHDNLEVVVLEIYAPPGAEEELLEKKVVKEQTTITISNLGQATGWERPGTYILPLVQNVDNTYRIAPLPASPGYAPADPPRIYPANSQTLSQLRSMTRGPLR